MTIDLTSDFQVLAATIDGEAENQPLEGKQAVAAVVMNRVAIAKQTGRKQFGNGTIRSACLEPYQFSCWLAGPDRDRILALDFANTYPSLEACIDVALDAINGRFSDPTGGATFYKTNTLPWPEEWGAEVAPNVVIADQSFYKLA